MRTEAVAALSWGVHRLCAGDRQRFLGGLDDVAGHQARLKQRLMQDLAATDYGRRFPDLPLATWEDLEPWLSRQIAGERDAIARGRITHVEPTSGSSGAVKRVPYTRAMMAVFARMFRIWAADLLASGLKMETGRIFLSQSPRGDVRRETQYLDGLLRALTAPFLVRLKHDRPFLDDVATTLLAERDLEVISVWSPSYLSVVLDHIERTGGDWRTAWPKLKLISCWDHGPATALADDLRARFPGVRVQGKGLLSTEAPLTVPIDGIGCLPMYQHVLFEFLPQTNGLSPEASAKGEEGLLPLHQLQTGATYEAVITTPSGLIRYRTGDLVTVTGHHRSCPILAFAGRTGAVSDLTGEKLSEAFVRAALTPLIPSGRFVMIPAQDHYILLSETPVDPEAADRALCTAHHYGLSRDQGQLQTLEVRTSPSLPEKQKQFFATLGQDFGHIKDTALISDPARAAAFLRFLVSTYKFSVSQAMPDN